MVGNQCIADLGISEVGEPVPQVAAVAEPKESDSRNGFLSDCGAGHPPPPSVQSFTVMSLPGICGPARWIILIPFRRLATYEVTNSVHELIAFKIFRPLLSIFA